MCPKKSSCRGYHFDVAEPAFHLRVVVEQDMQGGASSAVHIWLIALALPRLLRKLSKNWVFLPSASRIVKEYAAPAVLKCCSEIGLEVNLLIGHSHGSLVVNSLASLFKRFGKECPVIFLDPRTTENQLWSLPMSTAYTSVQNVSYPLFRLSGEISFFASFVPHPLFKEAERLYQEDVRIALKGTVWSDAFIAHIKDANHVAVSKFYDISTQIQPMQRQNDAERVVPAP
eukprot:s1789_g7.t1